jgi:hypothetical protein
MTQTQPDFERAIAEILDEAMTPGSERLENLTLGDALRIPAFANLIVPLTHPDYPLVADPDELHVASDVAADLAHAIAMRVAHEVSMRSATNLVRLADVPSFDRDAAQLLYDFMNIGALVVTEYIIERRRADQTRG